MLLGDKGCIVSKLNGENIVVCLGDSVNDGFMDKRIIILCSRRWDYWLVLLRIGGRKFLWKF